MQGDSGQERTERATPKRERDAREQGQVPQARELSTTLVLLAGAGGLLAVGDGLYVGLAETMRAGLSLDRTTLLHESAMLEVFGSASLKALALLAPFFLLMAVAAATGPLALHGLTFSGKAISFQWERLDPIGGVGRMFSRRSLAELVKALIKFGLVAVVAAGLLWVTLPRVLDTGIEPLAPGLAHAAHLLGWSFLALCAVTILIAVVDVPYQLWEHGQKLRMTRQEVRDELKENEGRPEVRARIRKVQQEMARARMMTEVPKADVIVTNPTHYAVALKYDPERMRAPIVVAKGADLVAAQIQRLAREFRVPRLETPPLARALYFSTKLNQEIPAGLYHAVAKVLAYVFQLRTHAPGKQWPTPPGSDELPIPVELRKD
ncbi:MAG: flagellar biosynthesis protein FlhB [Gammaproteobacteria bacterium]|nr:MAG: flagellar biosynthesis protein FlhB [Gammaproteobacteria bacterium]